MIRALLVGVSRQLFAVALIVGAVALLFAYGGYKIVRALTLGEPDRPKQEAIVRLVTAVVGLARAFNVEPNRFHVETPQEPGE